MAKAIVTITIEVPDDFSGVLPWSREQNLDSTISHWLEEGYFIHDYTVDLPGGLEYEGYKIEYPKEWAK